MVVDHAYHGSLLIFFISIFTKFVVLLLSLPSLLFRPIKYFTKIKKNGKDQINPWTIWRIPHKTLHFF